MPLLATTICLVIAITDGDTLKARCGQIGAYEQVKIRLAEIDAPEKKQPFGARSKESLSALCYGVDATITPQATDRYGRTVARVQCRGVDASAAQVQSGMAWVYTRYAKDPTLSQLQSAARNAGVGLWADTQSVPPWVFRNPASIDK